MAEEGSGAEGDRANVNQAFHPSGLFWAAVTTVIGLLLFVGSYGIVAAAAVTSVSEFVFLAYVMLALRRGPRLKPIRWVAEDGGALGEAHIAWFSDPSTGVDIRSVAPLRRAPVTHLSPPQGE